VALASNALAAAALINAPSVNGNPHKIVAVIAKHASLFFFIYSA
jgi:hypothetical protein